MQDKHLYEYAIIRVLPKVEREEFINVGIIMFSKKARFIKVLHKLNEERFNYFTCEIEFDTINSGLDAFIKIANGLKEGGKIATLDMEERFRWLTAVRSTVIQTSRPHVGLSVDLEKTFECLFKELVL